jgi:molecular chaperone IbpA
MRYDWTPLWRSTIGFDRLFDVLDEVQRTSEETYPPYNIERTGENRFQISVALAGFTPEEVALTVEQNVLTLEGRKTEREEKHFLHRGISARSFKRQFTLADHVEVKGASFENGLLIVDLVREIPEAMKPRRIAINAPGSPAANQIEAKAA